MYVLGIKVGGHDPGASLISADTSGIKKVSAIAEERLSRIKHAPHAFPSLSIKYVIESIGENIRSKDIDLVMYDTIIDGELFSNEKEQEIWIRKQLGPEFASARLVGVTHHDAHAATAFFCSPYDEAAVLVYDGNGKTAPSVQGANVMETETFYRGKGSTLTVIHKSLHVAPNRGVYPFSFGIGRLYSQLSANYIAFGPHNEGKMMGLAGYGDDSFLQKFPYDRWVREYNGELVCNSRLRYPMRSATAFAKRSGSPLKLLKDAYYGLFTRINKSRTYLTTYLARLLVGDAIFPEIFEPLQFDRPVRDPKNDKLPDKYYSSVAYAAQKIFEQYAIEIGTYLRTVTGSDTLCVGGGCALNIDANRNFITRVGFKNLFVQPASSDCGIPLGCALWGVHVILKVPRSWVMHSASLGRSYSREEVRSAVEERKLEIKWEVISDVPKEVARLIADGNIVGWFQGGAEYGPRALGNRSILSDARKPDMRDIMNKRVKHREMWRPFATSILSENLEEWFDLTPNVTTAYMLLAATVRPERQSLIPSIIHVDGTCRMQTLTEENNGIYYHLVREFNTLTGTPLILNTSFNLGGEPIVETPADAIDTFLRTDMDYLVVENTIIQKI